MLDRGNKKGAHFERRLRENTICWLSSVRPDGRPHLVAVWFFWDGEHILIFSQPNNQKVRNLRQNPRVTVALDDTDEGGDVAILDGEAELLPEGSVLPSSLPAYAEKYARHLQEMGWTAEHMAQSYSQPIRITPTKFYYGLVAEE